MEQTSENAPETAPAAAAPAAAPAAATTEVAAVAVESIQKDGDDGAKDDDEAGPVNGKPPTFVRRQIFKLTKTMAYRPILCCSGCFSFILLVVIIAIATNVASMSDESDYDWTIASTTESENHDALQDAIDQVDQLAAGGTRKQVYDENFFFMYHTKKGDDLYQPVYLQKLCEFESNLVLDPSYTSFCRLDSGNNCTVPQSSIVAYFYDFETVDQWSCTLLSDATVDAKKSVFYDTMDTFETQEAYGLWLGKEAPRKGYTTRCNSMWTFGAPLDGYESSTDDSLEQVCVWM
jgi:hypothetical protein